jgi:hypothetical protein
MLNFENRPDGTKHFLGVGGTASRNVAENRRWIERTVAVQWLSPCDDCCPSLDRRFDLFLQFFQ